MGGTRGTSSKQRRKTDLGKIAPVQFSSSHRKCHKPIRQRKPVERHLELSKQSDGKNVQQLSIR